MDFTYRIDSSNPNEWRVLARVDAASEQVLDWEDRSKYPAHIIAPEQKGPKWNEVPVPKLSSTHFIPGDVIDPATLHVRWCMRESGSFPTELQVLQQERAIEITWNTEGEALNAETCEVSDAGQLFVRSRLPSGRILQWHVPSNKRGTTKIKFHRSPTHQRVVMVVADQYDDKTRVHFYSRLGGPQIFILHDHAHSNLATQIREKLGQPALFLSKDPNDPIFVGYNRMVVVRASAPKGVVSLAQSISRRFDMGQVRTLDFNISTTDDSWKNMLRDLIVADVLIVHCGCPSSAR